jgi:hypothetical protein
MPSLKALQRLVRPFTASNDLLNDQSAAPTAP